MEVRRLLVWISLARSVIVKWEEDLRVSEGWSVVSNVLCAKSPQSCLTLCNPMDCSPPCSSVHGDSPGKNTGVGSHALLQGILPTQGSNLYLSCLLHWQMGSLPLVPLYSWFIIYYLCLNTTISFNLSELLRDDIHWWCLLNSIKQVVNQDPKLPQMPSFFV